MVHKSVSPKGHTKGVSSFFYLDLIDPPRAALLIFPVGKTGKIMSAKQISCGPFHFLDIQFFRIMTRIPSGKYMLLFPQVYMIFVTFPSGAPASVKGIRDQFHAADPNVLRKTCIEFS